MTAFDEPVVDDWLECKIAQTAKASFHHAGSILHAGRSKPIQLSALLPELPPELLPSFHMGRGACTSTTKAEYISGHIISFDHFVTTLRLL